MDSDTDEVRERLIETLRPQLVKLIKAEQVVDFITFFTPEQKEQILHQEGDFARANRLITEVLKKPHPQPGWFRGFVDALDHGGCEPAARYMNEEQMPSPEEEAERELYSALIQILCPSLLDMDIDVVCFHCFSAQLISQADMDIINAEAVQRNGARKLLGRIVQGPEGWFSTFLDVLRKTEHYELYKLLTGLQPPDDQSAEKEPSQGDEPTGNESPVPVSEVKEPESRDSPVTNSPLEEHTDLYKAENTELEQPANSTEASEVRVEGDSVAAAASPQKHDIVLRDYQMEVARPALEGKNIIICLPTGSGKTRVAVYITKEHLDTRKIQGLPAKVIVLVNKVPLVEQHYSEEFSKFLKPYKVERVSGNCQLKISFAEIVKNFDVVVCTAQILENYLERSVSGEDEGVHLSDLSLIVIDECHHTQKGGVYNHIMMRFLKQKHKNKRLEKEQKETKPLPQILGLTASPGVGGATKMSKTEEHILRICANLDASTIMTANLGQYKKESHKKVETNEGRKSDPFGDVIKKIMNEIHAHAELSTTHECGTQTYEQWVVQTEREAAKEGNQKERVCAFHLQQYNSGLQLSNTIRMCDSFSFLEQFYNDEFKKKTSPEDGHVINQTETERFLFNLFRDNRDELMELTKNPEFENASLSKLRTTILKEFTSGKKARGIIFTKTRRSAMALVQWVKDNVKFEEAEVSAAYLIGGGDQSVVKPMTSAEQKDVLKKFGSGKINLLIATTVAEEGLDIPACNFVIRYGLVTNEISMIQARGRGREANSTYTLVETEGSNVSEKETVNEYRINMMNKAIEKIRGLEQNEYNKRILEFQIQAILEDKLRVQKNKRKDIRNSCPSELKLNCRGCNKDVCTGDDVEIIENMHRVNVSPQFSALFMVKENNTLRERHLDYETNGYISCKTCGHPWGTMMHYRGIDCPCLHVKNFAVTLSGKKISKCSKWSELPVKFKAFDYADHAYQMASDSDEEENE